MLRNFIYRGRIMNSVKKTLCVFLALVLCFCAFADVLTMPAEATPAVIVAAGAVVVWIFGLLGLNFASMNAASDAAEAFYNSDTTIKTDVDTLVESLVLNSTAAKLHITPFLFPVVLRLINAAREFFGTSGNLTINDDDFGCFQDIRYVNFDLKQYDEVLDAQTIYNYCTYMAGATQASCTINGVDFNFNVGEFRKSGNYYYLDLLCNGATCRYSYDRSLHFYYQDPSVSTPYKFGFSSGAYKQTSLDISNIDFRYGFYLSNVSDVSGNSFLYLLPFAAARVVTSDGIAHYFSDYASGQINDSNRGWLCVDPSNLVSATTDINYDSYSNVDITALTAAIEALQQTMTETQEAILDLTDIYNALTDTAEGTEEDEDTAKVPYVPSLEWLKQILRDLGLTLDEIKAITEGAADNVDNPSGSIKLEESDFDAPTLPDLKDKFPFCVPFDLIGIISALNAEPEAPKFVIPLQFDKINFRYDIEIDFAPFERVAEVCRWTCIFSFLVFLALVTRKIIQA